MAVSNATTREAFEVITSTFEDRLDREATKAKMVGTAVVVILTAAMVLGGQFLTW